MGVARSQYLQDEGRRLDERAKAECLRIAEPAGTAL